MRPKLKTSLEILEVIIQPLASPPDQSHLQTIENDLGEIRRLS
jgi:hypothetical protein